MQSTWAVMVSSCTISPINKFVRQQKYSENVAKDNLGILCWPFCTHTAEQCKANIYFLWWIKSGLFTAILLFSRSSIFYLYSVMNVTDGHLNGAGWLGEASGRWLGGIILIMSDKLSGASLRIISRHDHGPPAPGHELIRGAPARMLSLLCPSRIYASFSSYFQLLLKYEEIHLSRAQMCLAVDRNLRPGCCGWAELGWAVITMG